jgi:phosphohistidine swiveling domain-containing protein
MHLILWLEEIQSTDGPLVGSKALNLATITRAGFTVPAAFCLTTEAYQDFMQHNGLLSGLQELSTLPPPELEPAASRLRAAIRAGQWSTAMRRRVLSAYRKLAQMANTLIPVAARSSATAEDLPNASFAGQQATLLNLRNEPQLLTGILECWASLWSPQAVAYRAQRLQSDPLPSMAVLVQRMVEAEASGVAFSRHPVRGDDCLCIEAAYGLGEAVVSGSVDVDRYIVDRDKGTEAEPPTIAYKPHRQVLAAQGGLAAVDVPAEKREMRVLSPTEVHQIAQAVLALERHFGCAQDMEWALDGGQLYILQARPITTSALSFFTDVLPEDGQTWTSGFLNERFPLPVSPLGWTVIQGLLEELAFRDPLRYLGLTNVDQVRITRLYRGHPYVNMWVFQALYKIFPRFLLPEDAYRYFPQGRTELRREASYPRSLFDPRLLWSMARYLRRHVRVWSPWHNDRLWAKFATRHEECCRQLQSTIEQLQHAAAKPQQIWAAIEQAQQLNRELLSLHRWSLTLADLSYTLLRRLVRAWAGPDGELCTHLVTGLPNRSLQMDQALQVLAQVEDRATFAQGLQGFLADYGHRSFSLDIYHPTFDDEPEQVMALIGRLRDRPEGLLPIPPTTIGSGLATRELARDEAQGQVLARCGQGPLGWLKRGILSHVLWLAQRYMPLREDQRFYWQKALALIRKLFLSLGQQMVEAGALQQSEEIFFLTRSEVDQYVQGPEGAVQYSSLAAGRRVEFATLCREHDAAPAWAYPPFLLGNQPLPTPVRSGETRLQGRGVSPGLARGPVVVLFSPSQLHRIKPGSVLVTRSVDPAWTPVFGLLGALVTEHGGQLSHGAVVAREYALPAVAGVPGATQWLHDGDWVLVDGLNGVVAKVEEPPTKASNPVKRGGPLQDK